MFSKKTMLLMALSPLVVSAELMAATSGTVGFSGALVNASCVLSTGSESFDVDLGKHTIPATVNAGDVIGSPKNFTITVTGCPTDIPVNLSFSATTISGNDKLIETELPATGVGIEILAADGSSVPLDNTPLASTATTISEAGTDMTFSYDAQIVAAQTALSPGAFTATATYTIVYE